MQLYFVAVGRKNCEKKYPSRWYITHALSNMLHILTHKKQHALIHTRAYIEHLSFAFNPCVYQIATSRMYADAWISIQKFSYCHHGITPTPSIRSIQHMQCYATYRYFLHVDIYYFCIQSPQNGSIFVYCLLFLSGCIEAYGTHVLVPRTYIGGLQLYAIGCLCITEHFIAMQLVHMDLAYGFMANGHLYASLTCF